MLSGNSLRQTVHTHRASVHQVAKLVAALLRVARVTAGLAESNGSLPPGLWLTSPAGWLPRTGIISGTLHSVIEYGLPLSIFEILLEKPRKIIELNEDLRKKLRERRFSKPAAKKISEKTYENLRETWEKIYDHNSAVLR